MRLLYGKPLADEILTRLSGEIFASSQKPGLAVVLAGADKPSRIYVTLKQKRAQEIGMRFFLHHLPIQASEAQIVTLIEKLNVDPQVHGIIVQLPLPTGLDPEKIIHTIAPAKDADGFLTGRNALLRPVFPAALWRLAQSSGLDLPGKKAVVLANSIEFGQTMVKTLQAQNLVASFILAPEIPSKLEEITQADVVVSALGTPGALKGRMFKDGALVLDGGISQVAGQVLGDVDLASTEGKEGFLSPVPGGVGPLTIACLLENTYQAFLAQNRKK